MNNMIGLLGKNIVVIDTNVSDNVQSGQIIAIDPITQEVICETSKHDGAIGSECDTRIRLIISRAEHKVKQLTIGNDCLYWGIAYPAINSYMSKDKLIIF